MIRPLDQSAEPADAALQVYLLGTVPFEDALALQRLLAYEVAGDRSTAALVLCDHPPLLTVGRHGSQAHIHYDLEELRLRRWAVRWVNRGGGCWLHLPGQIAVYPVLPLDRMGLGLDAYLDRFQLALADVLADFQVATTRRRELPGLWVGNRLIAPVGVAVRDWVSYFGAVVNIDPDLELLRPVHAGSPGDGPMTSLARERRGPLRVALVRERLIEHFAERFGFGRTSLFFHHPFLDRKTHAGAVTAKP
jgi:lipoyl(octanoyl) transferase